MTSLIVALLRWTYPSWRSRAAALRSAFSALWKAQSMKHDAVNAHRAGPIGPGMRNSARSDATPRITTNLMLEDYHKEGSM